MSTERVEKRLGQCYVGVSGWAYEDWNDTVYAGSKQRNAIRYLAQWINAIEVNVTFYRPVSPNTVRRWISQIEDIPDFLFTVKLWSRFTHSKDIQLDNEELSVFIDTIEPLILSGRLGCVLIQFPHRFHRTIKNRKYLAQLTESLLPIPLAIEFRHKSWMDPNLFDSLKVRNIAFCNIDQPIVDSSCIPPTEIVTADFSYVRFHGRNKENWFSNESNRDERYNYLYSEKELGPWVQRISNIRQRVSKVFVMMNNHYKGKGLINAWDLRRKLNGIELPPLPSFLLRILSGER
ncbi:MAG: DUF72 domain-containing protein [Candidatus Hydrogenedentes bacterium]|nr:DUF72 domain-containing protein [Candidatus Hydrogenedentota bacterium]